MNIIERFFVDEQLDALNNIGRWAKYRRIKEETVAHHSFIVSLFSDFLVEELFPGYDTEKILSFKLKVVRASLKHDMGEIISGDVDHETKNNGYNGELLSNELEKFVMETMLLKFNSGSKSDKLMIYSMEYFGSIAIKQIIKVSDFLSSLFYIYKERQMGNKSFDSRFDKCKDKLETSMIKSRSSLSAAFPTMELDFKIYDEIKTFIDTI